MDYQYDIFLSYNRDFPTGEWVKEIFYPLFRSYIKGALNKNDVSIFMDTKDILGGSDWQVRIRSALIQSRVVVSVLIPDYFQSEWCMREFTTLYHRSKTLGCYAQNGAQGLVVPIRLFDGQNFPDYVRPLQMLDCVKYYRVGEGFKNTPLYSELQGILQQWVFDVAPAVAKAPGFKTEWSGEEWVEKPFDKIGIKPNSDNIKPPLL